MTACRFSRATGRDLEWFICAQVIIEYWVVATRPRTANGMGLSAAEAQQDLSDFTAVFSCLPEPPDMADRWREVVSRHHVLGRPAHDARLVALMQAHDVKQLLTLNTGDFARYGEIESRTPRQMLDQNNPG